MTWVIDTTDLFNLGRTNSLWILQDALVDPKIVTTSAYAEILYPESVVQQIRQALSDGWIELYDASANAEVVAGESIYCRLSRLGAGEFASLAACIAHGWSFASDDLDARRAATSISVPLTGTVGILLRAVQRDIVSLAAADTMLDLMIAAGYYAPVARISDIINR